MLTPVGVNRVLPQTGRMSWGTLPSIAAITPKYLQMLLLNAASGSYQQQWELFDLMLDTWPVLGSCVQELTYGIERKKLIFEPYREEDEQPTPSAVEKSQLCSHALENLMPDPASDENDKEGMVRDIISAWFVGLSVQEIIWQTNDEGVMPQSLQWAHPRYLGFNDTGALGLNTATNRGGNQWRPFPQNKFLVGIHKSKSGFPTSGALLRPLCWWWCAANFSADWLLNLAQLFGIPWRIGYYDPNAPVEVQNAIDQMLQNMGSASWGRFPITPGQEKPFELIQQQHQGSDHSPQGEMLDRADRYARDLILGQTMSGGQGTTGKGGGQAFGKVEHEVKEDRIDAAGKFVANVINGQLIKSILLLNYGNTDEAPKLRFLNDEEGDLAEAQRDKVLIDMGVPIGVRFAQKKYGIPEPAEDEELLAKPEPKQQFGDFGGSDFQDQETPDETNAPNEEAEPAKALQKILAIEDDAMFTQQLSELADEIVSASQISILPSEENARRLERNAGGQHGHPFYGNQYVKLGETVMTPHGKGKVVANDHDGHFVSVNGRIRKYKPSDIKRMSK